MYKKSSVLLKKNYNLHKELLNGIKIVIIV